MLEPDYFARKREQLGLDRADSLTQIQAIMNERYPGKVRVKSLNDGMLRLTTVSAPVASELRMSQIELLATIQARVPAVERIAVTIGALR